jgi:hypothetical protein
MNTNEIETLAQQHKKLLEKFDVFPYALKCNDKTYKMAHFYRLTSKLYGSFLYTPYNLSFEEVKEVFYKFILLEEYMKNEIAKLNKYASTDYTASYFGYREYLTNIILQNELFKGVNSEIQKIIDAINYFENSLERIKTKYKQFKQLSDNIKLNGEFTSEQLSEIQWIYGEAHAIQFLQSVQQENILNSAKLVKNHMDKEEIYKIKDFEEFYKKTKVLSDPNSEATLKQSLKKFGDYEDNINLSYEDLVKKLIKVYEKDFYKALDEDFIKRRVRNPSVRERS